MSGNYLLFHGAIVLMTGILTGLIFWLTIINCKPAETIRSWRVTHSVLIADGMMMILVGLIIPHLNLGEMFQWILLITLILSGYGFVFAFTIGAWKGIRGLAPKPFGLNTILFVGHFIGATGSSIGIAIVIYGLYRSL
jgi:hypothetical protein